MGEITHTKNKVYYSIGEVAEMFDVNASLIRFWEKKFDIIKPHKNSKGNRMFTPKDVDNFKLIYHLVKERGMTLAGAQRRLRDNKSGETHDMEIVDRLLSIRAMLVEIREELKQDGEIFSPEGYLDEEYPEDTGAAVGCAAAADSAAGDDGLVTITDEVRTEVVTDGSSPWDDPEEETGGPLNEVERDAAMEELRKVKNILAGWNDTQEQPQGTTVHDAVPAAAHAEVQDEARNEARDEANTLGNLGNIFDDELDSAGDYADPWEEADKESPAEGLTEAYQAGTPDTDAEGPTEVVEGGLRTDVPEPGGAFGTDDACSTFSPDDSEAAWQTTGQTAADYEEQEEPKRPQIYEQTLF